MLVTDLPSTLSDEAIVHPNRIRNQVPRLRISMRILPRESKRKDNICLKIFPSSAQKVLDFYTIPIT